MAGARFALRDFQSASENSVSEADDLGNRPSDEAALVDAGGSLRGPGYDQRVKYSDPGVATARRSSS
jgi:hypothetical protein